MKFLTCEIDHVKNDLYRPLLAAWENSVKRNCPNDQYEIAQLDPKQYPQADHRKNSCLANSVKLNYWAKQVQTETDNLCFIDGDTVVLQDLNHVFNLDFDIAFTRRSQGVHIPINGGVLFVRPGKAVNEFFQRWTETNNEMLRNRPLHLRWYRKYNGINQASFGYMIEHLKYLNNRIKIISVPCREYNACDRPDWLEVGSHTKVLHAKSELRLGCLGIRPVPVFQKAINMWKEYETRN